MEKKRALVDPTIHRLSEGLVTILRDWRGRGCDGGGGL